MSSQSTADRERQSTDSSTGEETPEQPGQAKVDSAEPPVNLSPENWTTQLEVELLTFFESREFLYNVESKDYSRSDLRKAAFADLSKLLLANYRVCATEKELAKKYNKLRSYYCGELRKEAKTASGQSASQIYKSPWKHFQRCAFLKPFISHSKPGKWTKSNLQEPPTNKETPDRVRSTEDIDVETTESTSPPGQHSPLGTQDSRQPSHKEPAGKRRKQADDDDPAVQPRLSTSQREALTRTVERLSNPDDLDAFADYVSAELRKIPEYNRDTVKLEIVQLLIARKATSPPVQPSIGVSSLPVYNGHSISTYDQVYNHPSQQFGGYSFSPGHQPMTANWQPPQMQADNQQPTTLIGSTNHDVARNQSFS